MRGFLGRWLSDALRLGLALALAVAAMQLPAVAHEYAAALLQVAEDGRRDIEQRKASARSFYPGLGESDDAVVSALRSAEPSNAQALAASIERTREVRAAYGRIEATAPLLRPLAAALDGIEDAGAEKRAVLWTALATHAPQVLLSTAAAIYGVAGLFVGALLAEAIVSAAAGLLRQGGRRTQAGPGIRGR